MSTTPTRQVPAATAWRVARGTLGRMACIYGDPAAEQHDHAECVRDDEAYAADLMLGLLAAVVKKDEGAGVDRLADLIGVIRDAT